MRYNARILSDSKAVGLRQQHVSFYSQDLCNRFGPTSPIVRNMKPFQVIVQFDTKKKRFTNMCSFDILTKNIFSLVKSNIENEIEFAWNDDQFILKIWFNLFKIHTDKLEKQNLSQTTFLYSKHADIRKYWFCVQLSFKTQSQSQALAAIQLVRRTTDKWVRLQK